MAAFQYDVGIIGAGPIGIATACSIKLLQPYAKVFVADKRPEPTRNHGLNIRQDSVDALQRVLREAFKSQPEVSEPLRSFVATWAGNFVRTSEIERRLGEIAQQLGITVIRDKAYEATESDFEALAGNVEHDSQLLSLLEQTKIIIGADGAHSTVRKFICKGEDEFAFKETLRYLVELKYQTTGATVPRGYSAASKEITTHGQLSFESMSTRPSPNTKPVTLHVFVKKEIYDDLRIPDESGQLKGVFGNSWNLEDLRVLSEHNMNIAPLYAQLQDHLANLRQRHGVCIDEKISTLSMEIYQSRKSVFELNGKYILLVGDAESGIVLEGGFNKGLKGAAACAKAVSAYLSENSPNSLKKDQVFLSYTKELKKIFASERLRAKIKNTALASVESSLWSSHRAYESTSSCIFS